VPVEQRRELLRRMNDAVLEQHDVVWATAEAFLVSGMAAGDLAAGNCLCGDPLFENGY
jgi:hypothetical protein